MSKQPSSMKGSPSVKVMKSKRIFTDEEKKEIGRWVEEVVGEHVDPHDLLPSLRSGTKLCKLINKLQSGVLDESRVTNESSTPAFEENLKLYLGACFQLGVRSHELFTVDDILHNGDLQALLRNIVAVHKASVGRGYAGPKLQISEQDENELERVWAEVAALRKTLQECLEDNKALRHENKEIKEHIAKQDSEISKLKIKVQSVERNHSEGKAPASPTNAADGAEGEEGEAPAVVYVIKKKKKLGREGTERGLRSMTSIFSKSKMLSKSTSSIYEGDEDPPKESSAVLELERSNSGPVSPGREASTVLVGEEPKKRVPKKKMRKGALGNVKNDQVFFQSLSSVVF